MSSPLVPKPNLPSLKICTPEPEDSSLQEPPVHPHTIINTEHHPGTEIIVCVGSRAVDKNTFALKEIYNIPVLLVHYLYGDQTNVLYLPPVPPYIVDNTPSPMFEISKFYGNPLGYMFPSVYKRAIQAVILADYLCCLSYLRTFEQELDIPYNSLIPVNGYCNIRNIVRDAYRVHEHRQHSDEKCSTCHKTIRKPLPPFKIYSPRCCPGMFYCFKHCNFSNCPICGQDTTPDHSNLKPIEISFYSSTDCKFKSLEELYFPYLPKM